MRKRKRKRKAPRPWTQAEIEILRELMGDYHLIGLTRKYNKEATRVGLPRRTKFMIKWKVYELGGRVFSDFPVDFFAVPDLCQILGVSNTQVYKWLKCGLRTVATHKVKHQTNYVSRQGFVQFAQFQPHRLKCCDKDGLAYLVESKEVLELIKAAKLPRQGYRTKHHSCNQIQRIDTGETFLGGVAAAQSVDVTASAIYRAISQGSRAGGVYWKYVD